MVFNFNKINLIPYTKHWIHIMILFLLKKCVSINPASYPSKLQIKKYIYDDGHIMLMTYQLSPA